MNVSDVPLKNHDKLAIAKCANSSGSLVEWEKTFKTPEGPREVCSVGAAIRRLSVPKKVGF